jgi:hypothetical protein
MKEEKINIFFKNTGIGTYIKCIGNIIVSPSKGQKYEMQLTDYQIIGYCEEDYPLAKSKMNLDTLRKYIHLRGRTNTFGSIFRIRTSFGYANGFVTTIYSHKFYNYIYYITLRLPDNHIVITNNTCQYIRKQRIKGQQASLAHLLCSNLQILRPNRCKKYAISSCASYICLERYHRKTHPLLQLND